MLWNALWIIVLRLYERAINSFGILTDRYDLYAAIVTITSVISFFLVIYVIFKMEKNRLFYGFLFLLVMIAIWIYSDLQKYLAVSEDQIIVWIRLEYLARLYTAVAWYVFSQVYTKRNDKINTKLIIGMVFCAPILFTAFSFQNFSVSDARTLYLNSPQALLTNAFALSITLYSLVKLNRFSLRQKGVFIKQVQLMTTGLFFVLLADILSLFNVIKVCYDIVPIGFIIFQFFIWKAITKYKLMEIVPIALREIFNSMNDGVIVVNEDGSIIDMNKTAKKWLGNNYNPKIDITIYDIIINLSSKITDSHIILAEVKKSINKSHKPIHVDLEIKAVSLRYFSVHMSPIINKGKKTIGHIVNIDDITEYKLLLLENENQNFKLHEQNDELEAQKEELEAQKDELEAQRFELLEVNKQLEQAYTILQETQAQLIQTEKMAALGQLVAGVAHEINTPLGSINSNIEITKLIAAKLANTVMANNDTEAQKLIEKFNKMNGINIIACNRILEIVRSLKNFSRLDEAEFQKANIHDGIDSTLILLNNQIKNRITLHKNYGDIPQIECYPNQLNQVFMNILVNAAQAIEGKGEIFINTYCRENSVYIEFIDSGKGIPKEYLHKVFDPGFTTKGVGVGTGLGLSITYKIIQKHNGTITAANTDNSGAKFTIQLPIDNNSQKV